MGEGTMLEAGREMDERVILSVLALRIVDDAAELGRAVVAGDTSVAFRLLLDGEFGRVGWDGRFSPSGDIAAAWEVVEKMRERGWLAHLHAEGGKSQQWVCYFAEDDTDDHFGADTGEHLADTAPLAICRAALSTLPPAGAR